METEETTNALMEAHEETNLGLGSERQRESSGDDAGLEREHGPAAKREEQPEDDGLGERNTLAGRKAKYEEEDRQAASNESNQHSELAQLLGCDPEELSIHKSLRVFSAQAIAAACEEYGLDSDDLADAKVAKMLAAQMGETTEEAEEESEEEEQPEKTDAEKEAEKPAVAVPAGKSISEFTPQERASFDKHVGEIYSRSLECNSKPYVERFTSALSGALAADIAADPQGLSLENTVGVLTYGAQSVIESTAPAVLRQMAPEIITEFMEQHFNNMVESSLPGIHAHYQEAECDANWRNVVSQPEFRDAKLPQFDTPEWNEDAQRIIAANPWFSTFPDDKSLGGAQALRLRANVLARLMVADRYSPATMSKAVNSALETGKQSAERNNRKVSAGRSLGSGRHHDGGEEKSTSLYDAYTGRNGAL